MLWNRLIHFLRMTGKIYRSKIETIDLNPFKNIETIHIEN